MRTGNAVNDPRVPGTLVARELLARPREDRRVREPRDIRRDEREADLAQALVRDATTTASVMPGICSSWFSTSRGYTLKPPQRNMSDERPATYR